jgi:hypothetical protein
MSEHRRRKPVALTPEQAAERFDTGGKSFEEALASVLVGGPDDGHGGPVDEREADNHGSA